MDDENDIFEEAAALDGTVEPEPLNPFIDEPVEADPVDERPAKRGDYRCPECGAEYTVAEADRAGSFCPAEGCADLMVLLERIEKGEGEEPLTRQEIGLGILVCDVSGSMEDFAFPDRRVSKMALVAGSVARGVWDLVEEMVEPAQKNAYVAIIVFAKEAMMVLDDDGLPFVRSVYDIGGSFNTARDFADFLVEAMRSAQANIPQGFVKELIMGKDNVKHYTNLNDALELAYRVKESCLEGRLDEFGGPEGASVIEDVTISPDGRSIPAPNVRVLVYSDGAHNYPKGSSVVNPFDADEPSVLISSFLGDKTDKGCMQMRQVAGTCPRHGEKAFFLIDDPQSYQRLRGLFRMSSGVSGFCPNCMPRDH